MGSSDQENAEEKTGILTRCFALSHSAVRGVCCPAGPGWLLHLEASRSSMMQTYSITVQIFWYVKNVTRCGSMVEQGRHIVSGRLAGDAQSMEAEFYIRDRTFRIYFRTHDDAVITANPEAFVSCALLPCMKSGGGDLAIEGEISAKYLSSLPVIQDIFCKWDASLQRVRVTNAVPVARTGPTGRRVGAFFSGGVDSFYTLLKHQAEITDLIFIDMRLDDPVLREKISARIRRVAAAFGKNVIAIETNVRELIRPYVKWGPLGHGSVLAAIGHLLSPSFRRIYIPTSLTYAHLPPWGSHPVLDHLWSTELLEFVHDGCEANRVEKVGRLSDCDIALENLRVCWKNHDASYNCGRCEKCLRTMINLKVHNALDLCTTFDQELDIRRVSRISVKKRATRVLMQQNLDALNQSQGNEELKGALRQSLNRPLWASRGNKLLKKNLKRLKGLVT